MRTTTQATGTALVMHEDVWVRSQLAATLGQEGYTVLAASNGASGMRLAEQHQPAVIVLGLALPELSGAAVLEQLQGCAATRDIPVLVVTAKDLDAREKRRLNGQVAAVLQKGSTAGMELLAWLRKLIVDGVRLRHA
jgi:DNA-binding response OmpR family regulator